MIQEVPIAYGSWCFYLSHSAIPPQQISLRDDTFQLAVVGADHNWDERPATDASQRCFQGLIRVQARDLTSDRDMPLALAPGPTGSLLWTVYFRGFDLPPATCYKCPFCAIARHGIGLPSPSAGWRELNPTRPSSALLFNVLQWKRVRNSGDALTRRRVNRCPAMAHASTLC